MSELVKETPLTPFEEMEAEYRGLPEKLSKRQNFYGQPPFDAVLNWASTFYQEPLPNLSHLLTLIPGTLNRNPKYGGPKIEEIDVQDKRLVPFMESIARISFGKGTGISGDVERQREIGREILKALDSYPFWLTYVLKHTSESGSYKNNGELKKFPWASPAPSYIAWVTEKLAGRESIEREEIRRTFGKSI